VHNNPYKIIQTTHVRKIKRNLLSKSQAQPINKTYVYTVRHRVKYYKIHINTGTAAKLTTYKNTKTDLNYPRDWNNAVYVRPLLLGLILPVLQMLLI